MAETVPKDLQEKIQRLQGLSAQMQGIAQQRSQMEMMQNEANRAKEALDALADDATVYRNVGSLMLKDGKATALARLAEEAETMEVRLKRYRDQEKQLSEQVESLQEDLQQALRQ